MRGSDFTIKPRIFTQDTIERLSMSKNRRVLDVGNLNYVPRRESMINSSLDIYRTSDVKK